ncbi:MAG: hypothetical protein Q8P36_00605 [bacterium]|nr:hypothetical protein [bacterium]
MHAFLLVAIVLLATSNSVLAYAESGERVIHLTDQGFEPRELTVSQGNTVLFQNIGTDDHWPASNDHPTHTHYALFDSKRPLVPEEEWSFVFDTSGQWTYHDHLYPQLMGTITVLAEGETVAPKEGPSIIEKLLASFADGIRSLWMWISGLWQAERETRNLAYASNALADAEFSRIYASFSFDCEPTDFFCATAALKGAVGEHGPLVAVFLLEQLERDGRIADAVDEHQLGHQIGRATAESFGGGSGAFLLCPMSALNGGCQHGFFEYVLARTETPAQAVEQICGVLKNGGYSPKQQFDCYHGVGHGIMMAQAYDLDTSLRDCNTLPEAVGREGCWQGVFMENVNGALTGQAREGVFSREDPLLPCSAIEEKYRHECFINHAGWLVATAEGDFGAAARACLDAPERSIPSCLQSLGLMTTNPSWQAGLAPGDASPEATAWELCSLFPSGHEGQCVIAAVDNLMNFHGLSTEKSERFCAIVDLAFTDMCYRTIGTNLTRHAATPDQIDERCGSYGPFEAVCREGAV